jgi:type IV secretion system T-DNA border endonuclease VirD1
MMACRHGILFSPVAAELPPMREPDFMNLDQKAETTLFELAPVRVARSTGNNADASAYKVVSVRLRQAEFICFAEQTSSAGMTNNQALRIAARRIAGFLETDEATRATLRDISRSISTISRTLSILNREAAASGVVDMEALAQERLAFGKQFVRLEEKLRVVLNVSQRRQDGMALLQKASRQ